MPDYEITFLKRVLGSNGRPVFCIEQRFTMADAASSASAVSLAQRQFQSLRHVTDWRSCADGIEVTALPDEPGVSAAGGAATPATRKRQASPVDRAF